MNTTEQLNEILSLQNQQLDLILDEQKIIRKAVTGRDWELLETHMQKLNSLSDQFIFLEQTREDLHGDAIKNSNGSPIVCDSELLRTVKHKLLKSRVENDSLHQYIKITQNFLQGIFDNVIPGRRNTLYSRNGQLVRTTPDALVLNTLS